MKAQATLEFLAVLAAFLAFLAAWAPLGAGVREKIISRAQEAEAQAELSRLAFASEEAYLLGDGNSREIDARALAGATIRWSDGEIGADVSGRALRAAARFRARAGEALMQPGKPKILVSCCSEGGVEFTVSTGSP
ncbi:MAG: hypothetical protein PHF51_03055 [Candidatus ainarchaeum sp.]|nr:hypothetical protein [Candidatus ainarchaeum sp.]